MTGQDIIDYIQNNNLEKAKLEISGYLQHCAHHESLEFEPEGFTDEPGNLGIWVGEVKR